MEITEKVVSNISIYSIIGQIKISRKRNAGIIFITLYAEKQFNCYSNMTQLEYINNAGLR